MKAKLIEDFAMFKGEIKFYCNILSKFDQLMDDYQDNRDKVWCNMLGYIPYKTIVFEDLKAKNFQMIERTKFQDRNHALLVLNSLARFHAIGYVVVKQGFASKEDFDLYYMEKDLPSVKGLLQGGLKKLCDVIETDWTPEWKGISEKLRKQIDVADGRLKPLFIKNENSFWTICHGDVWTCNMMFKYCSYDETIPIAVKLLDLQTTHLNSYGFDIMYYMYTSVRVHDRTTYWNELIAEYHRSLKSTLTDYGMEADAPTLDQIHAELKRLNYYGLITNLTIMPITIAEGDGKFEMEQLNNENEPGKAYSTGIFTNENFKAAAQPVLKKFLEEGYY
ncbi:hypothetical protein O3M35_001089 [Rhynocoris fuscipes]